MPLKTRTKGDRTPKLKIARGSKEIFWFSYLSILVFKGVRHGHVYWPKKSKALTGEHIMYKA